MKTTLVCLLYLTRLTKKKCNRLIKRYGKHPYWLIGLVTIFLVQYQLYEKPGKISCCWTFPGHHDSIIKRLVNSMQTEGKVQDKHLLKGATSRYFELF